MDCEPAPTSTDGETSVPPQGDLVRSSDPAALMSPSVTEQAQNNQNESNTVIQPPEAATSCSDTMPTEQTINTKSIVHFSMWDNGYLVLKAKETKLVEAYERLLSMEWLPRKCDDVAAWYDVFLLLTPLSNIVGLDPALEQHITWHRQRYSSSRHFRPSRPNISSSKPISRATLPKKDQIHTH